MKMYDRMCVEGSETHSITVINLLMEKLEHLNADLVSMVSEVRLTNPIVGNVLDNANKAMGLVTTANGNDAIGWLLQQMAIWGNQSAMMTKRWVCQSVMRIMIMMNMLSRSVINLYKIFNCQLITVVSVEFDTFSAIQYYSD